jgi:hypothetical protein
LYKENYFFGIFSGRRLFVHCYFRFCLNPHLRPARERFVRAVDHGTRPMDHDFVALAVFFIRFDCEDGQVGPLGVGADVVLINVEFFCSLG